MSRINFSTILKLAGLSLLVGFFLRVLNVDPRQLWHDVWNGIVDSVEFIFGRGLEGLLTALEYMLFGAMIVIPLWLLTVIFNRRKSKVMPSEPKE